MHRIIKGKTAFLAIFTLIFLGATVLCAAQYEIKAEVDRTEVAFGEALTLAVTITQELGAGGNVRMIAPNIKQIPGFDIASSRSSQSTRFINNYGYASNQVVFELVPREPGKKTIPAISFKDPEGKTHSTDPIEITVLPPDEKEEEPVANDEVEDQKGTGGYLFKGLLMAGIVFAILIALPFILSSFFSGKQSTVANDSQTDDENVAKDVVEAEIIEEKLENSATVNRHFDFNTELAELKKRYQEFDKVFCSEYFALFKRAAVIKSSILSEDMTPDELLDKIGEVNTSKGVKEAAQKLAMDIEMVMYAGQKPARGFKAIEEDVSLVLRAIED